MSAKKPEARPAAPPGGQPTPTQDHSPESPTSATQGSAATPPPGLDGARHTAAQRADHQAEGIRGAVLPAYLAAALGLDSKFDATGYQRYLQRLVEDAGSPDDPVERMLIEQLGVCHLRLGQIQAQAGQAKGAEAAKLLNSAAARLLGEFRRLATAIKVYRTPVLKDDKLRVARVG